MPVLCHWRVIENRSGGPRKSPVRELAEVAAARAAAASAILSGVKLYGFAENK